MEKEELKPILKSETSHNNDFTKDEIKELKKRRDELRKHPERGIKLEDL